MQVKSSTFGILATKMQQENDSSLTMKLFVNTNPLHRYLHIQISLFQDDMIFVFVAPKGIT